MVLPIAKPPKRDKKVQKPLKRTALVRKPVKIKKHKVKSAKWIRNKSDVLWRTYIKRNQVCIFENVPGLGECKIGMFGFEAAHLIGGSQSARIMYHPLNGVCACSRHHMILDNKIQGTLHKIALDHLYSVFPGRYEMLEDIARVKSPMKRIEWEEQLERLKLL